MKDYQASLHPLTLFLHLMHVVIKGDLNELDISYADSNEFLSKSRRARVFNNIAYCSYLYYYILEPFSLNPPKDC